MNIEINNRTKEKIDIVLLKKIIEKFLTEFKKKDSEVSVAFVDETRMRKLNKEYRGLDKVTDVLSFEGEGDFLGEIIICPNQIKRQAKKFGNTIKYETNFILVHGLLHLLGYDDETEKDRLRMIKRGEDFLESIVMKHKTRSDTI